MKNIKAGKKKITNLASVSLCLCAILFFFSCPDSLFSPYDDNIDIPPGMGAVTITLSNVARTILPNTPNMTDFTEFDFIFIATFGGTSKTETRALSSSYTINLMPGTYTLTIEAYKETGATRAKSAQTKTSISVTINEGDNTTLNNVVLYSLYGEGTGTFSWNVLTNSITGTVSLATMRVLQGGSPVNISGHGNSVDLQTTAGILPPYPSLSSGLYTVEFTITRTDGRTVVWNEIMHIYATMNSHCVISFTDAHFNNPIHTVTFNNNYSASPTIATQSVIHGNSIQNTDFPTAASINRTSDAYLYLNPAPALANVGWTVEGWYNNAIAASGTKFISTTPVHTSLTLYANWTGPIDVSASSGSNDVEKAITYVMNNASDGDYTLYVAKDTNISSFTLNSSDANLTLIGMNAPTELNLETNTLTIGAGALTLGANIKITSSSGNGVIVAPGAVFTLSGNASVDTLTLNRDTSVPSNTANAVIASGWNGTVGRLNLMGGSSVWENKIILTGSVDTSVINKITLGQFLDGGASPEISSTHSLELDETNGVLKIKAPVDYTYTITGDATNGFTATGGTLNAGLSPDTIQNVIDAIRKDAAIDNTSGNDCTIIFESGGNTLDIGNAAINFDNNSYVWGKITLEGKITSSINTNSYGTLTIVGDVNIKSSADISNTNSTGVAIYKRGAGGIVEISGGTVTSVNTSSSSNVGTIYNAESGTITITGGTISNTNSSSLTDITTVITNASTGTINISGGTVTMSAGYGRAIANNSTGLVNISGGTVQNTSGANGGAIRIYGAGTVTISGNAEVKSANSSSVTANMGTINLPTGVASGNNPRLRIEGGTVDNTSSSTDARAIMNNHTGSIVVTGGTIKNANPNTITIQSTPSNNGNLTLGGTPNIIGHIRTNALQSSANLTVLPSSDPNAFNPGSKTYTLDFLNYNLNYIAVTNGADFVNNFTLNNSSYALDTNGNNLVIANATVKVNDNATTTSHANLKLALDYIGSKESNESYNVAVSADQTMASYTFPVAKISIVGEGTERTIQLTGTGALFVISGAGRNVTIGENITLKGVNNNNNPVVGVGSGGSFIMEDSAKITGNTSTIGGGGVVVSNNGTFTMNGGEISGNTSATGGGVYVDNLGSFLKTGGTIYGYDSSDTVNSNKVLNNGNVTSNFGHAVWHNSSPLTKRRDSTANTNDNMDSTISGAGGGWD